jgi:hypothetical protein
VDGGGTIGRFPRSCAGPISAIAAARSGNDAYPEVQHGDISSLKDYHTDDDGTGSDVINALIKAHCYWIREADVDGFRVDAVKHMGTAFMAMTSTIRHTRVRITPSQCDISLAARALGCRCAGEPWVL